MRCSSRWPEIAPAPSPFFFWALKAAPRRRPRAAVTAAPPVVAVQFLRPHPPILLDCGGRPCTLGPFSPGDLALLPARLAEDLVRRGCARPFSLREMKDTRTPGRKKRVERD